MLIKVSQLYSRAPSSISMLMAAKMDEISSECSRLVTGLSSGFFTTLEPIGAKHIVFREALSMVKKFLLRNILVIVSPPFMQELY
jgi:hypothetical protein